MNRRRTFAVIGAGVLALGLASCTSFAPVYGDRAGGGMALARFNFAPPTNRLEQVILNRLKVAFPEPPGPTDPIVSVTVSSSTLAGSLSSSILVGEPVAVRVTATLKIARGDETVFTATRASDTSYQGGKLSPTERASAIGAGEQAAAAAAEALRAAILAGYRP
ncbi:hypothetical protein [Devosia chinhatensis]|uniref:Lipoprotein n=1 Tax=Devosia chinhatensis TaxID=429727 RepID=A0A0F5FF94_9HYPH|nr:hypothetical protein [Devosia chinhatensis]KKB07554.1 hypothetical protein VE26_12540 [Devosia chinhatensis]